MFKFLFFSNQALVCCTYISSKKERTMKIRVCNESGRTLKVLFVNNPFEIVAIDSKFDYWEYN